MKVTCPDCKERFEISVNDYDEGDAVECPNCACDYTVKVNNGRFKLITDKEKYYENDELDVLFED